jgi:hypothetical protein
MLVPVQIFAPGVREEYYYFQEVHVQYILTPHLHVTVLFYEYMHVQPAYNRKITVSLSAKTIPHSNL